MSETIDFAEQAERDLRQQGKLAASTCRAFDELSPSTQAAFSPVLSFLGCQAPAANGQGVLAPTEAERIAACRLMLLGLRLDGDDPAWSSYMLDRLVESVVRTPGGSVGDLFHALYDLLADHRAGLSQTTAYLIKQLVILSFMRQRQSYDSVDWGWFAAQAVKGATQAQLYLALHAVPPEIVGAQLTQAITTSLAESPFQAEVVAALAG